jgi:hypothetical protein
MIVYSGTHALGEIEDHPREGVRAFVGVGDDRKAVGVYPTRREAMRAVSAAAEARKRLAQPAPFKSGLPG